MVTLVSVKGSSYRKPGTQILIDETEIFGLISGGCLEQEIANRCRELFDSENRAKEIRLDTRQFLGCDGQLRLWCERIKPSLLKKVLAMAKDRVPGYITVYPDAPGKSPEVSAEPDQSGVSLVLPPPRRLMVFGSTPDVEPVLEMAKVLNWEAFQIVLPSDPRGNKCPQAQSLAPDQWRQLGIDSLTACLLMNHHFGRDLSLLRQLWVSDTPYLGLLGSRKRRDQLLEQLIQNEPQMDLESRKLHAPIGLSLGGEGPEEIALEICAEIQQVLSQEHSSSKQSQEDA